MPKCLHDNISANYNYPDTRGTTSYRAQQFTIDESEYYSIASTKVDNVCSVQRMKRYMNICFNDVVLDLQP